MRKLEIACNKQFLLFSQWFLPYMSLIFHFKCTLKCRLPFVSIWTSLKIWCASNEGHLSEVKIKFSTLILNTQMNQAFTKIVLLGGAWCFTNTSWASEQKWKLDTPNFCDQIFNIRYKAMIFFFALGPQNIWIFVICRDIKKLSPVGCFIDKR